MYWIQQIDFRLINFDIEMKSTKIFGLINRPDKCLDKNIKFRAIPFTMVPIMRFGRKFCVLIHGRTVGYALLK